MSVLTVYSDVSDGHVYGYSPGSYSTARSTAYGADENPLTGMIVGQTASPHVFQTHLRFDTSSLGSTAVPSAAVFSLYGAQDNTTQEFICEARAYDAGATLTTADYVPGANLVDYTLLATLATSGCTTSGYNDFTSEAGFPAAVNKTGYTGLMVSSDRTRTNQTPTVGEYYYFHGADVAGTTQDPKLVITYTATTEVSTTRDVRWSVLQAVPTTRDIRWQVLAPVSDTSDLRWSVLAAVTDTLDLRWQVLGLTEVSTTRDLRWSVLQVVADTADLRWQVAEITTEVSTTRDVRWSVLAAVGTARDLRWTVSQAITKTLDLRWGVVVDAQGIALLRHEFIAAGGSTLSLPIITMPGKEVVKGFQAKGQAPGGFMGASAEVSQAVVAANPAIFVWGTEWLVWNDDGTSSLVWAGHLNDPQVVGGSVLLHGEGTGQRADKVFEHLLWQTRDLDRWSAADSDPHNYASDSQIQADINGRSIRFRVRRKEQFLRANGKATLVGAVNKGDESITMSVNGGGLVDGEKIHIGGETRIVKNTYTPGSTTVPITQALSHDHANGEKVSWHASGNPSQWDTGVVFWAPEVDLNRIYFEIDKERNTDVYDLQLLKATGPDGALTLISTYSLAAAQPTTIDQAITGNPDLLVLRFRRQSHTERARAYRCIIKNVRVNGLTASDNYPTSSVVADIAGRVGASDSTAGVQVTTRNAMPLVAEDVSAGQVLDELALLDDFMWAREHNGTVPEWVYQSWAARTYVLTDTHAPVALVPLERYNKVRVPHRYPGGVRAYVTMTAIPNPLPVGRFNTLQIDLDDPLPSEDIAEALGQNLANYMSLKRFGGTAVFSYLEKPLGTRVQATKIRAGDTLRLANYGNIGLRVVDVQYGDATVTVTFAETHPLLERILARRTLMLARGRGNASASLGGFDLAHPAVPENVQMAFFEADRRGGKRRFNGRLKWDEVTEDIDVVQGPAITLALSAALDDIVDTTTSHGLGAGDQVRFIGLTGGAGLVNDTTYYVIATSLAAATFRVSATAGGAGIDFTTDITAGAVHRLSGNATAVKKYVTQWRAVDGTTGVPITEANGGGIIQKTVDKKDLDDPEIDELPTHKLLRNLEKPHSWKWQGRVQAVDVLGQPSDWSAWTVAARPAAFGPPDPTGLGLDIDQHLARAGWDAADPDETETDGSASLDRRIAYFKYRLLKSAVQFYPATGWKRTKATSTQKRVHQPRSATFQIDVKAVDHYGNESAVVSQTNVRGVPPDPTSAPTITIDKGGRKKRRITVTGTYAGAYTDDDIRNVIIKAVIDGKTIRPRVQIEDDGTFSHVFHGDKGDTYDISYRVVDDDGKRSAGFSPSATGTVTERIPGKVTGKTITPKTRAIVVTYVLPTAWSDGSTVGWSQDAIQHVAIVVRNNAGTEVARDNSHKGTTKVFPFTRAEIGALSLPLKADVTVVGWDGDDAGAETTAATGSPEDKNHRHAAGAHTHGAGGTHHHAKGTHTHGKGHKHWWQHDHKFSRHEHAHGGSTGATGGHGHGGATSGFSANPGGVGQHNHIIDTVSDHAHSITSQIHAHGQVIDGANDAAEGTKGQVSAAFGSGTSDSTMSTDSAATDANAAADTGDASGGTTAAGSGDTANDVEV